jgi:short-subunit dehydrogenase
MSHKTALVTGASSGFGHGLALALGRRGTHVVAAARRRARLDELVDEIARSGGSAEALELDVGDADATYAAVRALDERLSLELVIANAGVGEPTPATDLQWPALKHILQINLLGAAATLAGALPGMVARGAGHIVGVASLAAFKGLPRNGAYCASKAGLATLLESFRVDLHGSGVAVTAVCPGFVKTELTAKNKHPMPFLMELDRAVDIIMRAIDHRQAVCAFPLPMVAAIKAGALMPNSLYDLFASKAL